MNIEKKGKELYSQYETTRRMMESSKFYADVYNQWKGCTGFGGRTKDWVQELKPMTQYEERIRATADQEEAQIILDLSDPERVVAYNQLVDEFNADLERIRETKDQKAAQDYMSKAIAIIYNQSK